MEKKIIRTLNVYYYGMMLLAMLVATLMYLLLSKGFISIVETYSELGQILQYVVIFDALITIPAGLYLCKRKCSKLALLTDEVDKLKGYKSAAKWRILMVSNTMVVGIAAFYIMNGYESMLWITAISAIGWYFSKPSVDKLQAELEPQDTNQEQY